MIDYLKELNKYTWYPPPYWPLDLQTIFQDPYELAMLSYWIENKKVKTYLEIGVASGGLMHYFINALKLEAYGIDTVIQPTLMVDPKLVYVGDSGASETVKWAKDNGPYDMVFIDGDHLYEGVKKDWKLYGSMATKIVVFHDIFQSIWLGPRQVWNQIEGKKLEINSNVNLGIGIYFAEGGVNKNDR